MAKHFGKCCIKSCIAFDFFVIFLFFESVVYFKI